MDYHEGSVLLVMMMALDLEWTVKTKCGHFLLPNVVVGNPETNIQEISRQQLNFHARHRPLDHYTKEEPKQARMQHMCPQTECYRFHRKQKEKIQRHPHVEVLRLFNPVAAKSYDKIDRK